MASSPGSVLRTFLLLLTLLLPKVSSIALPEKAHLIDRHTVPAVPDANDPAFQATILNNVNTFRDYQNATGLGYCADLANYSAGLANECNIDIEADSQYGEIVTGGPPSNYDQGSWDNFSLADAAIELIRGWYETNISYIADPSFTLLPFGQSYTQLVWKATTRIGCAWTSASCKLGASSAFYLRCAFSPKGNVDGEFEENVSCNGCSNSADSPPSSEVAPFQERQVQPAGSAFGDLLTVMINKIRADAGVPLISWNVPYVVLAETLAQKCNGPIQRGESLGIPIHGLPSFIPTWDATRNSVNAWSSQPGSANFKTIIDPIATRFGCSWNKKICPSNNWYLHCFFGRWDTGIPSAALTERAISTRQSGLLDVDLDKMTDILVDDLLPGINALRKESGQPPVAWSDELRNEARDRGEGCFEQAAFGLRQVLLNDQWPLGPNPSFDLMSLTAPQIWNKTKPQNGGWDPNSVILDYVKITKPQWKSVGCYWSRNCTAENNYLIYCEFSPSKLDTHETHHSLAPRQDSTIDGALNTKTQETAAGYFLDMRKARGFEGSDELVQSYVIASVALADANMCNGLRKENSYPVAIYRYDDVNGVRVPLAMTVIALRDFQQQEFAPNPNARVNYNTIVNPKSNAFGCAWSTDCGSIHYFYCVFGFTQARGDGMRGALLPRQDVNDRLQFDLGNAMIRIRMEAELENYRLVRSGPMVTQSLTDANRCSVVKDNSLYAQARYQYNDARGVRSKEAMNLLALLDWIRQRQSPDPKANSDYEAIVDPNNKQYGCAWSTECGEVHYLYCSFYHG